MSDHSKVALITGAAKRLGRAATLALSDNGYRAAIHYNNSENEASILAKEINSAHGEGSALIFRADLSDPSACKLLVSEVSAKFGRLDLLVNNASVFEKTAIENIDYKDIEKHHSIHVTAPAILSLSAAKSLKQGGPGRIINILDIFARYPRKGFLPYTISKAALESLTRQLAMEFAPHILVNAVAPGAILNPEKGLDEDVSESMINKIPLRRFGEPEDIQEAVVFLSKSNYMTGQTIVVDGGRSLNI